MLIVVNFPYSVLGSVSNWRRYWRVRWGLISELRPSRKPGHLWQVRGDWLHPGSSVRESSHRPLAIPKYGKVRLSCHILGFLKITAGSDASGEVGNADPKI